MSQEKALRSEPFTPAQVESVVKKQLQETGLTTGIIDRCVSDLLTGANTKNWPRNKLVTLTIAAVLDALSDELASQAAVYVNKARANYGATWKDVCLTSGYAHPNTAALRFDKSQHQKELERSRTRKGRPKVSDEATTTSK